METFIGSLTNFKAWEGGKYTLDILRKNNDCGAVECMLDQIYFERREAFERGDIPELITRGELNDFLWFERDFIANWFAYKTWDEYEEEREKYLKK